jgi:hypothetical protein
MASVADLGGTESREQRAEGGGRSTNPGGTKEAAAGRSDSREQRVAAEHWLGSTGGLGRATKIYDTSPMYL